MKQVFWIAPLLLAACVEQELDVSAAAGGMLFAENCAACHGTDARGAGPVGKTLSTTPPDLTKLTAQNGGTFPRDKVISTIDGLDRGTHFNAAMPEFGAGDMGPTVVVEKDGIGTPIPSNLLALSSWLESIQD